jgi:hypothetical protein
VLQGPYQRRRRSIVGLIRRVGLRGWLWIAAAAAAAVVIILYLV